MRYSFITPSNVADVLHEIHDFRLMTGDTVTVAVVKRKRTPRNEQVPSQLESKEHLHDGIVGRNQAKV